MGGNCNNVGGNCNNVLKYLKQSAFLNSTEDRLKSSFKIGSVASQAEMDCLFLVINLWVIESDCMNKVL